MRTTPTGDAGEALTISVWTSDSDRSDEVNVIEFENVELSTTESEKRRSKHPKAQRRDERTETRRYAWCHLSSIGNGIETLRL